MKSQCSQLGFSLVEVMCAILILAVGLVGLTQGVTTGLSSSKEAEVQTTAIFIAEGRMEALRAEGYLIDGETEGEFTGGLSNYRWKETITASDLSGLHEVLVVVENVKTGKPIYEIKTLLFEPEALPVDETEKKTDPAKKKKARQP